MVTPSQVTCPLWPAEQLRSIAEQLLALTLLEQDTVVPAPQFAVALQRAFGSILGRFAAKSTPLSCGAQEPVAPGSLRIAARTSGVRGAGAGLGVWAKPATETKRRVHATTSLS